MEPVFPQTFLTVLLWHLLHFAAVNGYIYDNRMSWAESSYFCGSCLQSPINVVLASTEKVTLPPLILKNYNTANNFTFLVNDGNNVHLKIDTLLNATVTGGNNDELFVAEKVYFHWGEDYDKGTEHAINFVQHALEVQIVHRNVAFPDTLMAYRGVNGFLNFGILFSEVVNEDIVTPGMKTVCSHIHSIRYHDQMSTALPKDFTLESMLVGLDFGEYFTYCGSLTIPPCTPNVIWIVFAKTLHVHRSCLNNLRSVLANNKKNMTSTFRPLQAPGSRKIFYNVL